MCLSKVQACHLMLTLYMIGICVTGKEKLDKDTLHCTYDFIDFFWLLFITRRRAGQPN